MTGLCGCGVGVDCGRSPQTRAKTRRLATPPCLQKRHCSICIIDLLAAQLHLIRPNLAAIDRRLQQNRQPQDGRIRKNPDLHGQIYLFGQPRIAAKDQIAKRLWGQIENA